MTKLSTQYNPQDHEQPTYKKWADSGVFAPPSHADKSDREPFTVMLPPPNITGSLHMGHALQDTIMDILVRWHRMQGDPTLWLPGTDHAAIATNKIIEKQLHAEGKTRHDVGREDFMRRTQDWYDKTSATILQQMKALGCSCDWSRSRFTMDDDYYQAVQEHFIRYYEQGYIYRGQRIVNWDPATQTTVSDLEVEWVAETVPFYTFQYGPFQIGTARPETKFGDKYVVMHPDDQRYIEYKHGDTFEAQWINGPITATIIKDEAADPEFGTGVMTITPWHDATDFSIAQKHKLDVEQIIDLNGKLLPIAGEFKGLTIKQARAGIVKKLKAQGLLVDVKDNYKHNIALNQRGQGLIEPQIMRQWFVDMQKLKTETIAASKDNAINFVPQRWKKHFIDWMEGVHDWNINRQIWLGHRLPVWWKTGIHGTDKEDEEGSFVVSKEQPRGDGWEQDPDTLDTWFSSALWPFATLGWPKNTSDLKRFYPTSVLVTARDILYLWVARMVFSGLELTAGPKYGNRDQTHRLPFKDVFIHATVLTKDGRRMSKSLGTGIDPLDLIQEYGADATRHGLMYQMAYDNQAIKFDENALRSARNFINKLWNLARLLDDLEPRGDEDTKQTIADAWIQDRAAAITRQVTDLLAAYKLGEASRALQDFVWKEYADWYIEVVKHEGSTDVAQDVFNTILTLLHPFMPHVTEVLWQHRSAEAKPLIISPWPTEKHLPQNHDDMDYFMDVVSALRSARNLFQIPPGATIDIQFNQTTPLTKSLQSLARAKATAANPKQGAKAVSKSGHPMHAYPVTSTSSVLIGSEHITPDNLARVTQKLTDEQQSLDNQIAKETAILNRMSGKAPQPKIAARQAARDELAKKRQQITRSLELLQSKK